MTPALAVALAGLLFLAACGTGGKASIDTGAPPSTARRTSSAPPTTLTPDAQLAQDKSDITATIVDFNRLFDSASATPASPPAAIFDLVAEPETTAVKKALANLVATGQSGHEPSPSKARTSVSDIAVQAGQASASQCSVNDFVVTDGTTGRVLNDHVGTYLYKVTLARAAPSPHGWAITSSTTVQRWEGVAGCAVVQ